MDEKFGKFHRFQTSSQSGDYAQFYNIVAKNNGNVTGRLEFKMQAHCDIDYTNFPDVSFFFPQL